MLLTTLKWLVFAAVMLLIGQISVGNAKIGERFYAMVRQGVSWSGKELRETKVFASVSNSSILNRWFNNVYPPPGAPKPAEASAPLESVGDIAEVDSFTATDRESILRLLD